MKCVSVHATLQFCCWMVLLTDLKLAHQAKLMLPYIVQSCYSNQLFRVHLLIVSLRRSNSGGRLKFSRQGAAPAKMYSCELCSYWTYFEHELQDHEEENHPSCDTCQRVFRTHNGRHQHFLTSSHHNHCGICDRDFQSPAALRGHQETHQPRDIRCPQCDRGFPSASAMAKHAELGKCFGLTQQQWVKKVRDWEVRSGNPNLLTVPRLGYSDNNASSGPIQATVAAYNGYAFECYFCTRAFGSLVSLNQHLNSGVHLTKEFRCKNCGFTAIWLSGLIAHIESEKCGFMSRSQVRKLATPLAQLRLGN